MRAKVVRLIAVLVVMGGVSSVWAQDPAPEPAPSYDTGYMGVDNVFLIREANPNVTQGEWEFELGTVWQTYKSGARRDDGFAVESSIKYGFTDTFYLELGVLPINLGDGTGIGFSDSVRYYDVPVEDLVWSDESEPKNGNGESAIRAFWQFLPEEDVMPAMALSGEVRMPTGDGSNGIDGTLFLHVTKTLSEAVRGHFQGYLKAADGARGDLDRPVFGDRRHFQYGVGLGLDFALNEDNLLLLNYQNRASEYYGSSSVNSIEVGWVHHLAENQDLQIAGTYNDTEDPAFDGRWQARVQWAIAF
jgi:hypothetical protein